MKNINIDTKAPTLTGSRTPAANEAGWNNSEVTVKWVCDGGLSGVDTFSGPTTLSDEGVDQSVTGSCADKAGNTATATVEDINIDLTKPTIKFAERTEANTAGWNNGPVTVTWDCADELAGMAHDTVSATVAGEGANQSATQTCTDKAGNTSAPDTVEDINIDLTKPTIKFAERTEANTAGWNNGPVTVTWDCADELAGWPTTP